MPALQSFNNPLPGDTATFTLPAGAFALGFNAVDTNLPPTVTMTDTVSGVVVTLSQQLFKYITTVGSTFKFTVTVNPNSAQLSSPVKRVWAAAAKLSNETP